MITIPGEAPSPRAARSPRSQRSRPQSQTRVSGKNQTRSHAHCTRSDRDGSPRPDREHARRAPARARCPALRGRMPRPGFAVRVSRRLRVPIHREDCEHIARGAHRAQGKGIRVVIARIHEFFRSLVGAQHALAHRAGLGGTEFTNLNRHPKVLRRGGAQSLRGRCAQTRRASAVRPRGSPAARGGWSACSAPSHAASSR